jgi:hypothetical protein
MDREAVSIGTRDNARPGQRKLLLGLDSRGEKKKESEKPNAEKERAFHAASPAQELS